MDVDTHKRYHLDANEVKERIEKRKATEAQITVWLGERKAEAAALNWTIDTVRALTRELGVPLEDVLGSNLGALGVMVAELGIPPCHVLDSLYILEAIARRHMPVGSGEQKGVVREGTNKCRDCKKLTNDYYPSGRCNTCEELFRSTRRARHGLPWRHRGRRRG